IGGGFFLALADFVFSFFQILPDGLEAAFRIFFQFAGEESEGSYSFREQLSELPLVSGHVREDLVLPIFGKLLQTSFFQFSVPEVPVDEYGDFLSRKKHVWRAGDAPPVLPISEFRPEAFYERKKLFFRPRILGFDPTHDVGPFFGRKYVGHGSVSVFRNENPFGESEGSLRNSMVLPAGIEPTS
ncbi:MAG: hypothetical protein WA194_01455, partial [Patescibacteria group bacterium]